MATKTTKTAKTTKATKTAKATTPAAKTPAAKTAKKKVTLVAETPAAKTAVKKDTDTAAARRGRKIGTLGFKWVKAPKEPWPSVLECNIMDACEAVEQGTSGDVTAFALKHGLGDLTRQIPNKVVTHVMVKLRAAGIIKGNDALKAKAEKTPAVIAKPVAKKAKRSRIVMESPAVAQDASATA